MRRNILPIVLLAVAAPMAHARQSRTPAPRVRVFSSDQSVDGDRAMLGVSTSAGGKRDTLGLLVESVSPGSPAEKSGLLEGDRIASINGVSLKVSHEDAGDPDMADAMTNRLVREMRKLKAGDEATLEVWDSGRYKTVKVKTVAASDLTPERISRRAAEDRAAIGVTLGSSGSKRDTLGVFVSAVSEDGPAEKAGIVEGDRIASVNGVDLRVPKADVGDWSAANARIARLQREIANLKPGQTVELSVVESGRTRSVKVTLGRAADLERASGFSFSTGDDGTIMTFPRVPMAPMAPMAPMPPMAPGTTHPRVRVFGPEGEMELNLDGLRESLRDIAPRVRIAIDRELPQAMDDVRREMDRVRSELPLIRARLGRRVII